MGIWMPYLLFSGGGYYSIGLDDHWDPDWGNKYWSMVPYFQGQRVDIKFLPSSGYFAGKGSTKPSPFLAHPLWLCSLEVKEQIESVEGGVHQFRPFKLRRSKTGPVVAEYFTMNFCDPLDTIDVARSDPKIVKFRPVRSKNGGKLLEISRGHLRDQGTGVALVPNAAGNRHAWADTRTQSYQYVFVSDHLYEKLMPFIEKRHIWAQKTL